MTRFLVAFVVAAAACEPVCDPGQLGGLRFSTPAPTCLQFGDSTDPTCSATSVVQFVNRCSDAYVIGSTVTIAAGQSGIVDLELYQSCDKNLCTVPARLGANALNIEWDVN